VIKLRLRNDIGKKTYRAVFGLKYIVFFFAVTGDSLEERPMILFS